jgi:hypothetical protein
MLATVTCISPGQRADLNSMVEPQVEQNPRSASALDANQTKELSASSPNPSSRAPTQVTKPAPCARRHMLQ